MVEWSKRPMESSILSMMFHSIRGTSRILLVVTLHARAWTFDSQGLRNWALELADPSAPCDACTRTHTAYNGVVALSAACYKLDAWLASHASDLQGDVFCWFAFWIVYLKSKNSGCSVGTIAEKPLINLVLYMHVENVKNISSLCSSFAACIRFKGPLC